jgi:hypothetical protein
MSQKRYPVTLTGDEEKVLHGIITRESTGRGNANGPRRCSLPIKDIPMK